MERNEAVSRRYKMTTEKVFIEMICIRVVRETFYIWMAN